MREILFRGKQVDGEWVEGSFVHPCNIVGLEQGYDSVLEREDEIGFDEPVIPESVGQYTGLTDRLGKRIFEGDIVRFDVSEEVCVIEYDTDNTAFKTNAVGEDYSDFIDSNYGFEVIGNIHDNPELLEVVE